MVHDLAPPPPPFLDRPMEYELFFFVPQYRVYVLQRDIEIENEDGRAKVRAFPVPIPPPSLLPMQNQRATANQQSKQSQHGR
jgi:hypothetical protein